MFWAKQAITKKLHVKGSIINTNKLGLDEWAPPKGFSFANITSVSMDVIAKFIEKNNDVGGNTITFINKETLDWLLDNWDVSWVVLMDDSNEIAAFAMSPIFKCILDETPMLVGNTSYLSVREDLRKKGLAAVCIREIMRYGSANEPGVYVGYHQVSKSIGGNSIGLQSWVRPLNPKKCVKLGFRLKGSYNSMRIRYSIKNPDVKSYSWCNTENYKSLKKLSSKYAFRIDIDCLVSFIKQPGMFLKTIKHNGIPVAYLYYRDWPIFFKRGKKKINVALIEMYVGSEKSFRYIMYELAKLGYPLAYFHETGPLVPKFLTSIEAIKTDMRHVNLYNWTTTYIQRDLFLPFF